MSITESVCAQLGVVLRTRSLHAPVHSVLQSSPFTSYPIRHTDHYTKYCLLQILNPAETFGDIMLDYSCVECSSACITALTAIRRRYPGHRASEVERALSRGGSYVRSVQQADGSW